MPIAKPVLITGTLVSALLVFGVQLVAQSSPPTVTVLSIAPGFPYSGVAVGGDGALYGTTVTGRPYDNGTVYSASPGGAMSVLYRFAGGDDGAAPYAGVAITNRHGRPPVLYGTTLSGGSSNNGTVYSLTPSASGGQWRKTVLHSFSGGSDGAGPYAGVVIGSASDGQPVLYGTTYYGGTSNNGVIYALKPLPEDGGSWTESILHAFTGGPGDGANPYAGLALDSRPDGEIILYGTTTLGGAFGYGTVFSLRSSPAGSWAEKPLYSFTGGPDGASPYAGITIGGGLAGRPVLFGASAYGGYATIWHGAIFSLTPAASAGGAWEEATLHTFAGGAPPDGATPYANVVIGPGGALYGVTYQGGIGTANGWGTIFSLTPPAGAPSGPWAEQVLYYFNLCGCDEGEELPRGLASGRDSNGTPVFYGTTQAGGVVFSFTP
jgi:uncharacterized repeat protein (TIGR03803 family)